MWFIFRHGESFFNKRSIIQGTIENSFLTLEGVMGTHMNAIRLKNIYKEINWNEYKFVCSPLTRAHHSCKLIMESLDIFSEPIVENLIINRSKGFFEGLEKSDEIKIKYKKEFEEMNNNPWDFEIFGFENYKTLFLRLSKFIDKYKNEENLIIVAHGGVNKALIYLLEKENIKNSIEKLSSKEGNEIIKKLKECKFKHNDFYCFDGKDIKNLNY